MSAPERVLRADARRNRESVLDAAGELFAQRGDDVQMSDIADRAGLGVGTLYRHFADKQALRTAIIGRRFAAVASLARQAEEIEDPWQAVESLLYGYLEAAQADAGFRFSILGPAEAAWDQIADEKAGFATSAARIVQRAVDAGVIRTDFTDDDFVLVSRGAMANMVEESEDWRRYVELVLEGVRLV